MGQKHSWSAAVASVWAKSKPSPENPAEIAEWLPLTQHLADTAGIAGLLFDNWLSPNLREMLVQTVGGDSVAAKSLVVFLAGVHDLGKASPAFSVQVPRLANEMMRAGLEMDTSLAGTEERKLARHELVGFVALQQHLTDQLGFSGDRARQYASVVAAHHGLAPDDLTVSRAVAAKARLFGEEIWDQVRNEILTAAVAEHLTPATLKHLRRAPFPRHVQVVLSGLVIVADWVASDDALFPLAPVGEDITEATQVRVARAWGQLDFPHPWRPEAPPRDTDEHFRSRFALPTDARARPPQVALLEAAWAADEPALFILEAETGGGKTEAALAAAEVLAHRFGLGGVFVGLPTMATSDAMFGRFEAWIRRLDLEETAAFTLTHSRSDLNPLYGQAKSRAFSAARARLAGDLPQAARDEASKAAFHAWFSSSKRGLLANFAVGTIDQALTSALRSRHVMLRHLALASKVVIIDEAHAYSTYTEQYLERTLHWLGTYGVPVIVLSATLPSGRRRDLLAAYASGKKLHHLHASADSIDTAPLGRRARRTRQHTKDALLPQQIGYPSVVTFDGLRPAVVVSPAASAESRAIHLDTLDDSPEALVGSLRETLRSGGVAAVIRNTVRRVQETAHLLRAELPDIPVIVAHSRYVASDRAVRDALLVDRFGPPHRATSRPQACIVVASQVIEQSLDVDFDVIFTDLAPVDLLLQRMGRLHRHDRTRASRPTSVREPRLVLTGVDWEQDPPEPDATYTRIYHPHILYRTLAVLDKRPTIHVPGDVQSLIETVYSDAPIGPPSWQDTLQKSRAHFLSEQAKKVAEAQVFLLREGRATRDALESDSLIGMVHASAADPDSETTGQAAVRDGQESLEVLVLQRTADGVLRTPRWLARNGSLAIPEREPPERRLERVVLSTALRLPPELCHNLDALIETLERDYPAPQFHASRGLRGELILVFDDRGEARLPGHRLHYTYDHVSAADIGLEISRDEF